MQFNHYKIMKTQYGEELFYNTMLDKKDLQ